MASHLLQVIELAGREEREGTSNRGKGRRKT